MRVLVLGSSGQIGAPLCKHLEAEDHDVIRWDIENGGKFDLRLTSSANLLWDLMGEADFVFFLAYDVGGSTYLADHQGSLDFIDDNIEIMKNVFARLEETRKPFIFASSQMSNMTHSEYGVLKRLGEFYTRTLNGLTVRFWNVYGPEHNPEKFHVITDFIRMARDDGKILARTTGVEERNFLYVDDCSIRLTFLMDNYDEALVYEKIRYGDREAWELGIFDLACYDGWRSIADIGRFISQQMDVPIYFGTQTDTVQGIVNKPNWKLPEFYSRKNTPIGHLVEPEEGIRKIIEGMTNG